MQNYLQQIFDHIVQSPDLPLLTAFVLGVLVAINPCQLAINVSALTYEYRHEQRWKDGLSYALGRSFTYTLMGWGLMCLVGGGKNISGLQTLLSKAEGALPYVMIVLAVYMFYRAFAHHHHHGDNCHNCRQIIRRNGSLGALILGMTLALAFCPESAILYFGMMLPLSMSCEVGALVPLAFSIGAALPVLLLSWMMLKAINGASRMSAAFECVQRWLNVLIGILFIAMAVYFLIGE